MEIQVDLDEVAQPRDRIGQAAIGCVDLGEQCDEDVAQQIEQQALLALDVVVERRRLDADLLREHAQAGRLEAVLGEHPDGGLPDRHFGGMSGGLFFSHALVPIRSGGLTIVR